MHWQNVELQEFCAQVRNTTETMEAGICSTCGVHGLVIKLTELLVTRTFMLRNNVLCEYCSCAPVLTPDS